MDDPEYLMKCFQAGNVPIGITYNELKNILKTFMIYQVVIYTKEKNFFNDGKGSEDVSEFVIEKFLNEEFLPTIQISSKTKN